MKKEEGFIDQFSYIIPEKILALINKNPLISDLYLTDIGYYPEAKHHSRKRKIGVDQYILIYNINGSGIITINDTKYVLPADHFFIIPKNVPHAYAADPKDPWSIYWIHFSGLKANLFMPKTIEPIKIERGKSSRINERLKLFDDIFRNLDRGFSIETLEYINICLNYLLSSFTYVTQYRTVNEYNKKDFVDQSINYMLENLNRKLHIDDLAKELSLSTSHFSRLFTKRTGHSPINYFIQLKIQTACRLIDTTDWSIAKIATEIGLDSPFYFSRLFRKHMNMSPRAYRKRQS